MNDDLQKRIDEIGTGNKSAQTIWDDRIGRKVRSVVAYMLNPTYAALVGEYVHDTWIVFTKKIAPDHPEATPDSLEALTVTTAKNRVLDFLRSAETRRTVSDDDAVFARAAFELNPEEQFVKQEFWEKLEAGMSPRNFRILQALHTEGMLQKDLANELGITDRHLRRSWLPEALAEAKAVINGQHHLRDRL